MEFELRPAHDAEPAVSAAKRPWKLVGAAVIVAMVVIAGVLVAIRGGGGDDGDAAATQQIQPAPVGESSDDPVATTAPITTAAPATTAPVTAIASRAAPASSAPTTVPDGTAPPTTVGPIDVAPDTYSLEASFAQPTFPMRALLSTKSLGETVDVSVEIDASERMHVEMDMGFAGPVEMIFDVAGGVGYLRGESLSPLQTTDATWIAVNLEDTLLLSGMSYEQFRDSWSTTPDFAALAGIVVPTPLGLTEIDGETLMLYHYTIDGDDIAAAAEAMPAIGDILEDPDAWTGMLTYHVYVTEDNRFRRMEMDMNVNGEDVRMVMTFLPVEPDFEVALPHQADVELIDITQFAG